MFILVLKKQLRTGGHTGHSAILKQTHHTRYIPITSHQLVRPIPILGNLLESIWQGLC